jgi:hypothetical protein
VYPVSGVAFNLNSVPQANDPLQVEPQLIPGVVEITVPPPVVFTVTDGFADTNFASVATSE